MTVDGFERLGACLNCGAQMICSSCGGRAMDIVADDEEIRALREVAVLCALRLAEDDVAEMLLSVCNGEGSTGLATQCEAEEAEDSAEQAARWRARAELERALLPLIRRLVGPLPAPARPGAATDAEEF